MQEMPQYEDLPEEERIFEDNKQSIEILQPLSELEKDPRYEQLELKAKKEKLEGRLLLVEDLEEYLNDLEFLYGRVGKTLIGSTVLLVSCVVLFNALNLVGGTNSLGLILKEFAWKAGWLSSMSSAILATFMEAGMKHITNDLIKNKSIVADYKSYLKMGLAENNLIDGKESNVDKEIFDSKIFKIMKNENIPRWIFSLFRVGESEKRKNNLEG